MLASDAPTLSAQVFTLAIVLGAIIGIWKGFHVLDTLLHILPMWIIFPGVLIAITIFAWRDRIFPLPDLGLRKAAKEALFFIQYFGIAILCTIGVIIIAYATIKKLRQWHKRTDPERFVNLKCP